jgi:hypothetical protein
LSKKWNSRRFDDDSAKLLRILTEIENWLEVGSNYAARLRASISRSQRINGFDLLKIWSTNFHFRSINNLPATDGRTASFLDLQGD